MYDFPKIFQSLLEQTGSIDIANSEFKKMVADDDAMRHEYREWCHTVGSTEKNGFLDYCEEYLDNQNSIWDYVGGLDD